MSSFGRRGPSLPAADSVPSPATGTGDAVRLLTFEQATTQVVATLKEQLPLGLWAVTRRDGDEQVFLEVASSPTSGGLVYDIAAHQVLAWQGSLCQAMVDGAPTATSDASAEPAYAGTVPVRSWPVRTYIASPITTPDGGLYGTLCGYGPEVGDSDALQRMAPVVTLLAKLLGQVLLSEQLRQQAADREAHLYRLATRDHLTGVATRAVFHDRLAHALELHRAAARAGGRSLTVLLIDVDDFKAVNDTHGHATGDALLAHVGREWGVRVRPGNTLARIGGDEFALLVETGMTLDDVVAEITRGLAAPITVPGTTMCVTASVGVAHLDPGDPTPTTTELLTRADRALYATKAAGKAGVTVDSHTAARRG